MTATVPMRPLQPLDDHGYTEDHLHALPDDGPRYELIDGSIIVSPSATIDHNKIAWWLAAELEQSVPDDYVVSADQSTTVDDYNEPRPDVVVARVEHLRRTPFPIRDALLVVEVVSPSSVLRDLETKRALYAKAGVPSYWLVEPDEEKPTVRLSELTLAAGSGGQYGYVVRQVTGVFGTDAPWPLTIDLAALTERRARLMRRAKG